MLKDLKSLSKDLGGYCQKQLGFKNPPKLFFKQDLENSKNPFGKTAFYNPQEKSVTLFTSGRHIKDILRSLAHELVHHHQNLRGDLTPEKCGEMTLTYAQDNQHMRNMEKEAYLVGNMMFRDWEDSCKYKNLSEFKILKENKKMGKSVKISKKVLKELIATVLKSKLKETSSMAGGDVEGASGNAFAPSHYCVHHGGVKYEGAIHQGEVINHNWDSDLQKVTHYDMKLHNGVILESVPADEILVTKASLSEESFFLEGHNGHKRHDVKDEPEEVEEASTEKYDDDPALKGGQSKLPDELQKGIIDSSNSDSDDEDEDEKEEDEKEEPKKESKIQTPEQENTLFERRFGPRNTNLFEKLTKKWTR